MFRQMLLLAGVAVLFAGAAQAEAPEAQATLARSGVSHQEAPAPAPEAGTAETAKILADRAKDDERELHPDARPVYLNGGYFDGD